MSDENNHPDALRELISKVQTQADEFNDENITEAHIEFLLKQEFEIDLDDVTEDDAQTALDAFDNDDLDGLVAILKDYADDEEAVEQFRQEQERVGTFNPDSESGDTDTEVATVDDEPEPVDTPEVDDNAGVEELRQQVKELSRAVQQTNQQLQKATQGAQKQSQPAQKQPQAQQQQAQGGGSGMLGNLSETEMRFLEKGFEYLQSNQSPGEYEQMLQEAHRNTLEQTMNQITSRTRPSVGERVGQVIDDQVASEIAQNIQIDIGGIDGSGSGEGIEADGSGESGGSEDE